MTTHNLCAAMEPARHRHSPCTPFTIADGPIASAPTRAACIPSLILHPRTSSPLYDFLPSLSLSFPILSHLANLSLRKEISGNSQHCLHAQTVGDVSPRSLRRSDDAHHLPAPHAVVARHGVVHLNPGQLRVLHLSSGTSILQSQCNSSSCIRARVLV